MQDAESQKEAADGMVSELRRLEQQIDPAGPFFRGKQMTLVDCALLPWFLRMYVLEHYRDFSLPEDCPSLTRCAFQSLQTVLSLLLALWCS